MGEPMTKIRNAFKVFALIEKKNQDASRPSAAVTIELDDEPRIAGDQHVEDAGHIEKSIGVFAFTGQKIAASDAFEPKSARMRKEVAGHIRSDQENFPEVAAKLETVIQMRDAQLSAIMVTD